MYIIWIYSVFFFCVPANETEKLFVLQWFSPSNQCAWKKTATSKRSKREHHIEKNYYKYVNKLTVYCLLFTVSHLTFSFPVQISIFYYKKVTHNFGRNFISMEEDVHVHVHGTFNSYIKHFVTCKLNWNGELTIIEMHDHAYRLLSSFFVDIESMQTP